MVSQQPSERQADGRPVLEAASVLELGTLAHLISDEDREFLLAQRQAGSRFHKNISYRPLSGEIRGLADPRQRQCMQRIMAGYSQRVSDHLSSLAPGYADGWSKDYASFRPIEEDGRDLPLLRRNDLLHVDAFPTRPTQGGRILRFFTNISRSQVRIWKTGPPFRVLAQGHAVRAGLPRFCGRWARTRDVGNAITHRLGLTARRTCYDRFMLHFHDYLKGNADFQRTCSQREWHFAPGSSWVVFSDAVPHAVLSGCHALEQTFIVPVERLQDPASAPIRILEGLCGASLH